MTQALLDSILRYTALHADAAGLAQTPVPGLTVIRATQPSELTHAVFEPLVCLVLQGAKLVTFGSETLTFGAGDSLLVTVDVPMVSQIIRASAEQPYLSLVCHLDMGLVTELSLQMDNGAASTQLAVRTAPTDVEVSDAALRLMRLLDRPEAVPVLHRQLVRELHYWLLAGRHGAAIRRLALPESHMQRVARAIAVLRADFAKSLPVEHLASIAGMSPSSFHEHFRSVTSLSPRQFQKQLRLIEARRLMMSEGSTASSAAFAVGYQSVSQFTREYGRMFGAPPVRDVEVARDAVASAA